MKKYISIILSILLVLSLSLGLVFAAISESITVYRNTVKLEVNGKRVNVDNFLYNGTTYIPLRAVGELLDKYVGWNQFTNVASINDKSFHLEPLANLLPPSIGSTWRYDGFAEYSHEMAIINIINEEDNRQYIIKGKVGDPSDGESGINRNIDLKYTIKDNKIIQDKVENAMMDSKFDHITLIETPLVAGTQWTEQVVDKSNKKVTLNSLIQKVEVNKEGKKQYTVNYKDITSDYYETRVIEEGKGVIQFEKLMELEDESFPVSYFLFTLDL